MSFGDHMLLKQLRKNNGAKVSWDTSVKTSG